MHTNLPKVNFPLRGQIRSDEFTNLFNTIIDEIEAKGKAVEQIVDFLSNGFVYGLYCSKEFQRITVESGGYFWKGENRVIQKLDFIISDEPSGSAFVIIDPQTEEIELKPADEIGDNEIIIAEYKDNEFDYACRKKLDDFTVYSSDKRKNIVVEEEESLINLGIPERIAYTTADKKFHLYGGVAKGWFHQEYPFPLVMCQSSGTNPYVLDHVSASPTEKRDFLFVQNADKQFRFKKLYFQVIANAKSSQGNFKIEIDDETVLDYIQVSGNIDNVYNDYIKNKEDEYLVIESPGVHKLSLYVDGTLQIKLLNLYGVI